MIPNSRNVSRNFRNKVLVGAIVSALALGTTGIAAAQSTGDYALDTSGSPWAQTLALQNFLHSVNNTQSLFGDVTAQLPGGDSIFITANGSGSPFTNSANSISALAVGNNATGSGTSDNPNDHAGNSIALSLLGTSAGNSGLGILSGQLNEGNTVQASATAAAIATDLTAHTSGAVTTSDNAIAVTTQINDASSVISGELPTTVFSGSTIGSAEGQTANMPVDTFSLNAQGGVLIGNAQVNANNATTATVTGAAIRTTDATSGTVSADFSSNGNAINARFGGNRSVNMFAAQSGGAISYESSVVVANAQVSSAASGAATISASGISTAVTGTHNFTGTISQSGNSLDAASQANTASNTLSFADGISVSGNGSVTNLDLEEIDNDIATGTTETLTAGDLVLQNLQSTSSNDDLDGAFTSAINNSAITASVNSVGSTAATVSVNDNDAQSTAGGNSASNTLSASGASFGAGVVVGSQQESRTRADIYASIDDLQLGAYMTATNRTSRGSVTVADNSVIASANGNRASTAVDVSGTLFDVGGGTAYSETGYDDTLFGNYIDAGEAGIAVGNLQLNWSGPDASTTEEADVTGVWSGARYADAITAGASTVDGNDIAADASGNRAVTTLSLAGTQAQTSATLSNNQDSENDIYALLGGTFTGIEVDNGAVSLAALTVSGNNMASSAVGNLGSNRLATDFTNATLGNGDGIDWANPTSNINPNGEWVAGAAALTLLSQQYGEAEVVSDIFYSSIAVQIDNGNVAGAPVTLDANHASASAIGNRVDNTLSPSVGTLFTDGGFAAQIADLGSLQDNEAPTISASIDQLFGAYGQIYASVDGAVTGSSFSVADNGIDAFAGGNVANNTMASTGSHFAPAAVGGYNGLNMAGYFGSEVDAAFALHNSQLDGSGGYGQQNPPAMRSATIAYYASIGVAATSNVNGSSLSVNGNRVSADARSNYAGNSLTLGGFSSLTTTAGLLSEQASGAYFGPVGVSASMYQTGIGAGGMGGSVGESGVTVSANALSGRAVGNTAINVFDVDAGQLAGNSNDFTPFGLTLDPGAQGAFLGYGGPQAVADYSLLSTQSRLGDTVATLGDNHIDVDVAGNFSGGSLTIAGNSQSAFAQSNSATNTLALHATQATASSTLFSLQQDQIPGDSSSASVYSNYAFAAYVGGTLGVIATPVTVSGNNLLAQAGVNTASNALSVDADSAIRGSGVGSAQAVLDNYSYVAIAQADHSLHSQQISGSDATAEIAPGLTGVEVVGAIGGSGVSALTVNDNHLAAQAAANQVSNGVSLRGASSIDATTVLNNFQDTYGFEVTATAHDAQVGVYDDSGANVRNARLDVSGNSLVASASGNSAGNTIEVLPVALNAGSSVATGNSAEVRGGYATVSSATASHVLANDQSNEMFAINASVSDSSIGINPGAGPASPLLNSVATVSGNSASASASGNSAGNSILLASLSTGVASSALVSNQINFAEIGATVDNVRIGVTAGINSTSPVTVSGNIISAIGVGNSATNHIGIGN